jgi:hypothetical protein
MIEPKTTITSDLAKKKAGYASGSEACVQLRAGGVGQDRASALPSRADALSPGSPLRPARLKLV